MDLAYSATSSEMHSTLANRRGYENFSRTRSMRVEIGTRLTGTPTYQ
jgi:hypothetical protein